MPRNAFMPIHIMNDDGDYLDRTFYLEHTALNETMSIFCCPKHCLFTLPLSHMLQVKWKKRYLRILFHSTHGRTRNNNEFQMILRMESPAQALAFGTLIQRQMVDSEDDEPPVSKKSQEQQPLWESEHPPMFITPVLLQQVAQEYLRSPKLQQWVQGIHARLDAMTQD